MNKLTVCLNSLFLSVIFISAYYFLVVNKAVVEVDIATTKGTVFRIYYKTTDSHWTQEKSSVIFVRPHQKKYSFRLTDLSEVDELRIDTSENLAKVTVRSLVFKQAGYKPLEINTEEQFSQLEVANGIAKFSYSAEGFTVKPSTNDPFLIYYPSLEKDLNVVEELIRLALIVVLASLLALSGNALFKNYRFVLCCSLVVLTLISVMAGISQFNAHPDELVHVKAAQYFKDHTLPPEVGAPEALGTYSVYGTSRLHVGEIAYFFAGKFAQILRPLQLQDYLAMRYFNVTLFGILCLLALKSMHFRILLIPLLLSPQVWYLFSYYNSEGYSLFISLLVAYQMVSEKSSWNRMLSGEKVRNTMIAIVLLGILLGLLLLAKKNFYFFSLCLALYFVWRVVFKKTLLNKDNLKIIVSVAVVGLTVLGAVRLTDSYINDFEKSKRKYEARNKYAAEMFKPGVPLEERFAYLNLRERGMSAHDVMYVLKWGEKSFRTAFGGYGYTNVTASQNYYNTVRYACILLLLVTAGMVVVRGGLEGISLMAITLVAGVGLIGLSFHHSWTMDFQAQGRYFLPIVGMLSIFIFHLRRCFKNVVFSLLFCTFFGISVYSYIFVALTGITRVKYVLG